MYTGRPLRGIELGYALTFNLHLHGPQTVTDLIDALEYQGFDIVDMRAGNREAAWAETDEEFSIPRQCEF